MFILDSVDTWFPRYAVFDCDGVILDSETKWGQIQGEVFERWGVPYTQEIMDSLVGYTAYDVADRLAELSLPAGVSNPAEVEAHRQAVLEDLLTTEHATIAAGVDQIPGAVDLLKKLAAHMPVAVASNSTARILDLKMQTSGLDKVLTTWVSSDDIPEGKPHPAIYLEAIRRLGGTPQETLTVEDSWAGLSAATAAETRCLVFLGEPGASEELATGGAGRFDSFQDEALLAQVDSWLNKLASQDQA